MGRAIKINNVDFSGVAVASVTFVDPIPCTNVALSTNVLTFETEDETKAITATLTPANTTDTLVWSSSNENVASVIGGAITVHGIGTAVITATCGSASASITISQTRLIAKSFTVVTPTNKALSKKSNYDLLESQSASAENADVAQILRNKTGVAKYGLLNSSEYECIPVPYGATKIYVEPINVSSLECNMLYKVDTDELVTYEGHDYPKYIGRDTFVNLVAGGNVEHGQAVAVRFANVNTSYADGCVDYVYFE